MGPVISEYKSEDYGGVWLLHKKTISENAGFVKNIDFHSDLHDIPHVYEIFYVLKANEQVIGMVGLKRIDALTMEVKRLQVSPFYQGQKLGRRLMENVMLYAAGVGTSRLLLDVSEPQKKAQNLYLSLGFKIARSEERFLGPERERFLSIYMEKDIHLFT